MTRSEGSRVLVIAPSGQDAATMTDMLRRAGYSAEAYNATAEIARVLNEETGVVVLTAEALQGETKSLADALAAQPSWSDIPFVLLVAAAFDATPEQAQRQLPAFLHNAIILERPVGSASFRSALASAMRSRQKQFEMRDRLRELDRAREELADSDARLRLATEAAEIGLWDVDPIRDTLFWPPRVKAMFGISPSVDVSITDFYNGLHPEDALATTEAYMAASDPDRRALYDVEYRTIGKEDGIIRWVAAKGRGLFDENDRCVRLIGTAIDVTARKADELALRESEEYLRMSMEAGEQGSWKLDLQTMKLEVSPRCRANFGFLQSQRFDYEDLKATVHADDLDRLNRAVATAIAEQSIYDIEYRIVRPDGTEGWVHVRGQPVYAPDGTPLRMYGVSSNISASKRNELDLMSLNETLEERVSERTAQLMQAEAALRQSQKMEAVGQLTGGIAHDFNNMLTGVIGSLDLMKRRMASGRTENLDRYMDAASSSALRAAKLTERLLAFSRRQSLDLKPVDVNALILSLHDLLLRTVHENIALKIIANDQDLFAVADANQLDNAIINLAINARDAMPDGGQLTIEARAVQLDAAHVAANPGVEPGDYVVVAVTDTGVGMTPDILERVFDPFFTTKPIGQGTGLGLSMVYGFAQQSGGQVRIHTEPGIGTTVSIYLAAHRGAPHEAYVKEKPVPEGVGQTVLVVEDDPSVRLLIREVLEELSYVAIEVEEGNAAFAVLKSERHIDLMISDVGLPGMNGRQLAEVARQHRPHLPIMFVTGYAENAAIRSNFLGTNMTMITKPFSLDVLAEKISELVSLRVDL